MNRLLLIIVVVILADASRGADFDKGLSAARNGDFATALREWMPLAEKGNATAQINLGVMYEDGRGVPVDYRRAVKWYKRAAEQGDVRAQVNLGLMLVNGTGVKKNNVYAYMWWNLAASNGDKDAVSNRDIVAKKMSADDILLAKKLARECFIKKYKGC